MILLTNLSAASKIAAEMIVCSRELYDVVITLCLGDSQPESVSLRALGALNCLAREPRQHLTDFAELPRPTQLEM